MIHFRITKCSVFVGTIGFCLLAKYAVKKREKITAYLSYLLSKVNNKRLKAIKKDLIYDELIKLNKKSVFEIGCGCGSNLDFYPTGTNLYCLDMNAYNEFYLLKNLKQRNLKDDGEIKLNDYLIAYAENMSYIRSNSVDAIVCTFTLSCVESVEQVLEEVYRILKTDGLFIYMDYVESDRKRKYCVQFLLEKLVYSPFFGIKLINNLEKLILSNKKFKIIKHDKFELNVNSCIKGILTK